MRIARLAEGEVPGEVKQAAAVVVQHVLCRRPGAAYTYVARSIPDGVPGAVLLCLAGPPDEMERILRAIDNATREGR